MKISFDLDGTLLAHFQQLASFGVFMQERGHEVGLLTGRSNTDLEQNVLPALKQASFYPNFAIGRDFEPPPEWDAFDKDRYWKPEMIKKYKIDIHFDDFAERIQEAKTKAKILKI